MIRKGFFVFFLCAGMYGEALAQISEHGYRLQKAEISVTESASQPLSNGAVEILVNGDTVWIGGSKGLDQTLDGGATWNHFGSSAPFDLEDIAALDRHGSTLWASLAGSFEVEPGTRLPRGLGLAYSNDGGRAWQRIDQPMEKSGDTTYFVQYGQNILKALAVTTDINNISYDIAVTSSAVWTASFAGGLRKSTDGGKTFSLVVLPPDFLDSIAITDTLQFDLSPVDRSDFWNAAGTTKGMRGHLNHRVFSVLALDDSTIWVGTAGGVNFTSNGGRSWRRFSYSNQTQPITGNFVVALGRNFIGGREYVWASTINALDPKEYRGVSFTTNRGQTWRTALRGEFTHNFGFKDSIVYAATNSGIFRSDDGGITWSQHSVFVDRASRTQSTDPACYAIASQENTLWVANADGMMKTADSPGNSFGSSWTIFRAAQPLQSGSEVYAYPNPFSPDDEVCRIRYRPNGSGSVTIKVYDYAMMPVRTILQNATRAGQADQDEIWDGKDDNGKQAANGLYYIQVKTGDADSWAKVIVLQ